ncbi:hypothetical protein EWM64_g2938 [Hericium alpestre]|uniref:Fungal-type protein kinase domain-containing protein n=1 Tax=Hericium alpestre TaxID=135208 RepID=A0A4Z0A419_9AGAM|nr:hypothetical protein EWM64_g2938 [Hericium alpestre]
MFTRSDYDAPLGYLDDCDIAKCILAHEASSWPPSRHRAGEAIFMAVELLREEPPPHLYRHDLESFMYTLIWCALHFNLNGSEVPGINEAMERWAYGTRESIQCAKISLFVSADRQDQIFRAITPAFHPLEREIGELIYMFDDGHSARGDRDKRLRRLRRDGEDQTPEPWNEDTLNGHITYEKFMAAIGENRVAELDG